MYLFLLLYIQFLTLTVNHTRKSSRNKCIGLWAETFAGHIIASNEDILEYCRVFYDSEALL
jgi:hypothetical protein